MACWYGCGLAGGFAMDGGLRDRQLGLGLAAWSLALHGLQVRQWLGRRLGGLKAGTIAYPSECVRYLSGPLIPAGIRKLGTCPIVQGW